MTSDDAERLLRDTFSAHEADVGPLEPRDRAELLAGARRKAGARRRTTMVAATVATLAVIGVSAALATRPDGGGPYVAGTPSAGPTDAVNPLGSDQPPAPATPPDAFALPAGWVWQSSLGLQVAVPAAWSLNDFGCNMTEAPTFVDTPNGDMCLTPESPDKQVAVIGTVPSPFEGQKLSDRPVRVSGVPAIRSEDRLADGRYAGQLGFPGHALYLDVRTHDRAVRDTILASARLVDVDHVGCQTHLPAVSGAAAPPTGLIGKDPAEVAVCIYNPESSVLRASGELAPAAVATLTAQLRAAPAGRNPDSPASQCLPDPDRGPEAVLLLRDAEGGVTPLWLTYSTCVDRGIDNGVRQARVSPDMLKTFHLPLKVSYSYSTPL